MPGSPSPASPSPLKRPVKKVLNLDNLKRDMIQMNSDQVRKDKAEKRKELY